jgi:hypothetical protein
MCSISSNSDRREFGKEPTCRRAQEEWLPTFRVSPETVRGPKFRFQFLGLKNWNVNVMVANLMGSYMRKFISRKVIGKDTTELTL